MSSTLQNNPKVPSRVPRPWRSKTYSTESKMSPIPPIIEPEVLQSGFGANVFFSVWRFLRKLPANFSANFDGETFVREFFGLVFPGYQSPPEKFTPKTHAQNCRHSSPVSSSRTPNVFTLIFCLLGRSTRIVTPC